jgi:tRNA 2-thiocytidine biosynthesis protein TtcA
MEQIEIERCIIKKFRKEIWHKFCEAVSDYDMIQENDKIAVCISGGKDSFLMAKCFQELKRHGKVKFELEFICMNPGYNTVAYQKIKENADKIGIELKVFDSNIFEVVSEKAQDNPCFLCAKMRRGYLYHFASDLGCNKIALGHHFDDIIDTILLSMFYNGKINTMMPKLHSTNFEGMELIRPLYYIHESDIIWWKNYCGLDFIGCACNLKQEDSKRAYVKQLVYDLSKNNKFI